MVTVFDDSDINIDDVAFLQHLLLGRDAVTDYVVDRCADRLGEAVIIERGGDRSEFLDHEVIAEFVEFASADACPHMWRDHFQYSGGLASGLAHFLDFFGGLVKWLYLIKFFLLLFFMIGRVQKSLILIGRDVDHIAFTFQEIGKFLLDSLFFAISKRIFN